MTGPAPRDCGQKARRSALRGGTWPRFRRCGCTRADVSCVRKDCAYTRAADLLPQHPAPASARLSSSERLFSPASRSLRPAVLDRSTRPMRGVSVAIRCPDCHSGHIHRSRTKGVLESVLLATVCLRPFRCEDCDLRFFRWSMEKQSRSHRPARTS
jgi:predicted Zn-ribbon and HTH transcriptional regulator